MKIRNKKTGKIYKVFKIGLVWNKYGCPVDVGQYNSLAELNEEWEDAGDKNDTNTPLIKDGKVRKAVRAWAEANEVAKVYVCGIGDGEGYLVLYAIDNGGTYGMSRISIKTQDGIWIGKKYTIAELCGEEDK